MKDVARRRMGMSPADKVMALKDLVDLLKGFDDMAGLDQAQNAITQFIEDIETLDPRTDGPALNQKRERIQQHLQKLDEMLTNGIFSEQELTRYRDALRRSVRNPRQLRIAAPARSGQEHRTGCGPDVRRRWRAAPQRPS